MLHLQIISAHDLSKKDITSYVEVVPKIEGEPKENFVAYAVTEKVSKDTDPQYNQDILIPFYCFSSIQLIFYEKKLVGERSIARTTIPLNLSTFSKPQPITDDIELYSPFNGAHATVTYSVSYTPLTNIISQRFQNPYNIYTYLTYNPPLQHNIQEVHLFCKGVESNGTIYDPSTKESIRMDEEATKCGPSGMTQVFYFDHNSLISGEFFFYIKSMNYTGTVTLNFATSPQYISKNNASQYFCHDRNSSIVVNCFNGTQNTFALFPIKFLIKESEVIIRPIEISEADGIHNVQAAPFQAFYPGRDEIQSMKDYYANHPEGVAQQKIFNAAVKAMHGYLPKVAAGGGCGAAKVNIETVPGRSYSLKSAFKENSLDGSPKKVSLSLVWTSAVDQTYDISFCDETAEKMNPVVHIYSHDESEKAYLDYYDQFSKVKERIFFNLDMFDPSVKYISLCSLSNWRKTQNNRNKAVRKNWSNAYCIVSDAESKVKLMRFDLPSHDSPCGVFVALFIRGDGGDWKFMPVCRVFESKNVFNYPPMSNADSKEAIRDFVLSGAAK